MKHNEQNLIKILNKYKGNVPRYTSYPTAPHFVADEQAPNIYANWITNIKEKSEVSLYIHIPFCASMCNFCGCYTKIVAKHEPIQEYIEYLLKEIDLLANLLPKSVAVNHIHWGGGSPTMLRDNEFERIVNHVRNKFTITHDARLNVELDPRTATEEYVKGLAQAGINRASIGIQDFDPEVQQIINRNQSFEITKQAVDWLNQAGITGINMDLLYGLPGQTIAKVEDMITKVHSLHPSRIAFFGYAHVPWMKTHQKLIPEDSLPNSKERLLQNLAGRNKLLEFGFKEIGFDHFALPEDNMYKALQNKTLKRNFQGYTTDDSSVLIGLGASSIGYNDNGYVANIKAINQYKESINNNILPVERILPFKGDDKLRKSVIDDIMCFNQVNLHEKLSAFNEDPNYFAKELQSLEKYVKDEIISIKDNNIIIIKPEYILFSRVIASEFDSYLSKSKAKHSQAV